jgi:hypothetical protein
MCRHQWIVCDSDWNVAESFLCWTFFANARRIVAQSSLIALMRFFLRRFYETCSWSNYLWVARFFVFVKNWTSEHIRIRIHENILLISSIFSISSASMKMLNWRSRRVFFLLWLILMRSLFISIILWTSISKRLSSNLTQRYNVTIVEISFVNERDDRLNF